MAMEREPVDGSGRDLSGRWRPSYSQLVLLLIVAVEIALAIGFVHARTAYHADINGPRGCPDECLGTWLDMVALGILLVAWPVGATIVAFFFFVAFLVGRIVTRQ